MLKSKNKLYLCVRDSFFHQVKQITAEESRIYSSKRNSLRLINVDNNLSQTQTQTQNMYMSKVSYLSTFINSILLVLK